MGKIKNINPEANFLLSRPRMYQYESLSLNRKTFIDDIVKNYVKPNKVLRVRHRYFWNKPLQPKKTTLWELEWKYMIMLRKEISESGDILEILKIVYGITEKQFMMLEITNVFASYKWIVDELTKIGEAEKDRLNTKLDQEDIDAGAEELSDYGYYNGMKSLSENILNHNELMNQPYSIIFRDLAYNTLINRINKNKIQNASRKNTGAG